MLLNQSSGGYANTDGSASGFNHHQYQESLTGNNRSMSAGSAKYMINDQAVGVPQKLGAAVYTPANGTKIKYCGNGGDAGSPISSLKPPQLGRSAPASAGEDRTEEQGQQEEEGQEEGRRLQRAHQEAVEGLGILGSHSPPR